MLVSATNRRLWMMGVFLAVWLPHTLCPVGTSYDSRWTVHTALSLLHRGDLNLDEYRDLFAVEHYAALSCVSRKDHTERPANAPLCDGHFYSWYPPAAPVLLAPLIGGLESAVRLVAPLTRRLPLRTYHPVLAAFFEGDLARGHAVAEIIIASVVVALTAVAIFAIALEYLNPPWAALVALVYGFGTSAWSTGSRALWQHTPSMLMLSLALLLLVRSRVRPQLAGWAGLPLALAYALRPTNGIPVAALTMLILFWRPRAFPRLILLAAPVAALFLAYNLGVYEKFFSPYQSLRPPLPVTPAAFRAWLLALAGNLASPSRGLFIFTPVLLFAVWGMCRALRRRWEFPLSPVFAAIMVAHWFAISLYTPFWWAGHSYGPRLFTDMLPFFCFFLIPVFKEWQQKGLKRATAAVFAVLLLVSAAVHGRAAMSFAVWRWNVDPVNIDARPARAWDWSDPQPLRGLWRRSATCAR